jgi:hypothetical protein
MFKCPWILILIIALGFPLNLISSDSQSGRILFLIQQGEHQQALTLYQNIYQANHAHDYELLHRIGIGILDHGFRQQDPEIQLLTLFGANIAAHEDVYYILEESLKSRLAPIQLVALASLSQIQQDRADQAILRVLGNSHLLVRFEAVNYLCKKKHPQAVNQIESLMFKCPKILLPLFPQLLAKLGDPKSTRILRKLINDPSEDVRKAVILSMAKAGRDDFLPQIRQQALLHHYTQQEASAYALGIFKDGYSLDKLNKLAKSQYPSVILASNWALYQLGQESAIEVIEKLAGQGDVFAIAALGSLSDRSEALLKLVDHSNLQVRMNAILALFEQHYSGIYPFAEEIVIRNNRDLGFVSLDSPGGAFQAWKILTGASGIFKEDLEAYKNHLEFRENILNKLRELSAKDFIRLAYKIFAVQQNEMVPLTVELLEDINSIESLECLKIHQQKLGAPLIRNYCNLALYRLGERGSYGEQLCEWVKNHHHIDLIQFRAFDPWEPKKNNYTLTPIETSRLLVETFETFASNQDQLGIELLIDVIANGHKKNKYALAGILLRATQ